MAKLHILSTFFNPTSSTRRKQLFSDFCFFIRNSRDFNNLCRLNIAEIVFNNQKCSFVSQDSNLYGLFDCDSPKNNFFLRTYQKLWYKERAINLLIANSLPNDCEYVAWFDGDISFLNPYWIKDSILALEKFDIIQPFSEILDLKPDNTPFARYESFAKSVSEQRPMKTSATAIPPYVGTLGTYHTGFGWIARKSFLQKINGLMDFCVFNEADGHMAYSLIDKIYLSLPDNAPKDYRNDVCNYSDKIYQQLENGLGYVNGAICHYWHGPKTSRGYTSRYDILKKYDYNPKKHLIQMNNNLYNLKLNDKIQEENFLHDIALFFLQQNQDDMFFNNNESEL